jgi:hypothetical protein
MAGYKMDIGLLSSSSSSSRCARRPRWQQALAGILAPESVMVNISRVHQSHSSTSGRSRSNQEAQRPAGIFVSDQLVLFRGSPSVASLNSG